MDTAPVVPPAVAGLPPFPVDQAAPGAGAAVPDATAAVLALLRHRRSLPPAGMRADPIPEAWLAAILEAARWAPTHGMTEPWRFVVFRGQAVRDLGLARQRGFLETTPPEKRKPGKEAKILQIHQTVPLVVAVGVSLGGRPGIPEVEDRAAVACAVQNMLLAATALGLGSYWSTGDLAYCPSMRDFLGFHPPVEPMGFLFFGFPAGPWPAGKRSPVEDRASFRG